MSAKKTSVVILGAGRFTRYYYAERLVKMEKSVRLAGFVEPSEESRRLMRERFAELGSTAALPFFDTLKDFLKANKGPADCAVIALPHNLHAEYIVACLKAGMDVLVEKPMVLDVAEARRVMRVRDATGRRLSVAFPGSYSPALHKAKAMIAAGEIGEVMSIAGYAHQGWARGTVGAWRQKPEISGGGFLFDTGSHLVNTVVDLAGVDVKELCAVQDNRGTPVEISSAIAGRFANGVFFTLCAEGNSVNCQSRVVVIGTKGILITGIWGECLRIIREGNHEEVAVEYPPSVGGVLEQFLKVRAGKLKDPCPAEVGLRFAKLMDLVRDAVAFQKTKENEVKKL